MYNYHALINALSAHMIHINLNMIFCATRFIAAIINLALCTIVRMVTI